MFIDAQAGFVTVYGKLQNYMTPAEAISIDRFYKLDNAIRTHDLDDELVNIVLKEMSVGDPVFIYANKNGAHFPYSDGRLRSLHPTPAPQGRFNPMQTRSAGRQTALCPV